MSSVVSKLALGTANFGMEYGIKNQSGRLSDKELMQIFQVSNESGITTVDTAQAYGNSEWRLGRLVGPNTKIITKISIGLEGHYQSGILYKSVAESLKRLNIGHLHGLLLHRPELLLGKNSGKIIAELKSLKEKGIISKIGVSIYAPDILNKILEVIDLDIVQAPFNIFDQRIYSSGWVDLLKANGTEIHTRSAFLQGVILMGRSELPEWFRSNWPSIFDAWFNYQTQVGESADTIALSYVLKQAWADKVVVGVDNSSQLERLVQIEKLCKICLDPSLSVGDLNLIEPSNWKCK